MSFADELENFRMEEESAQQFFFGYLALQHIPGDNSAVLKKLNDTPTFWITARYSLLLAAFVALGRIFDQDHKSVHNIDKLLRAVSDEIALFNPASLEARRIADGMDPTFAREYAADKYTLTPADVRSMRKTVAKWRRIYELRYRDIRHLVMAHRGIPRSQVEALFADTKIDEMKDMLGFLHALYGALWELHVNGRKPDLTPTAFRLLPRQGYGGSDNAGERMYRDAVNLQYSMLDVPTPMRDED
ncbi:AbiU2 domain-containing protein [Tardiphaga sp. vice278]|uniref:AbiU2 domain-containing protein n=1 Tax=Tardiphaga sp. vice278 TaxID=2592815 RepID=UPI00116276EC|nr:hypothetical protein [Tardiphaga sp. vice278]QDM18843.1 hypothetical protein FNL53_24985 [Tardiphaga sp. vice278]